MIGSLRRRLTLLVAGVLLAVSAGIVLSIGLSSWRDIETAAWEALAVLSENGGQRPALPVLSEGGEADAAALPDARPRREAAPPWAENGDLGRLSPGGVGRASLSNSFAVTLSDSGEVTDWRSDREDLYDDEQVRALAARIAQTGLARGRLGAQFFRSEALEGGGTRLLVLDQRLEVEAFRRQKQFVWDASHELKTPLAVISANAELLEGETGPSEWLGYIRSEVDRTNRLVQNLLTLARMDQGSVQAQMADFDLSKAVLSVALPFESTVYEAGKTMDTDVPDGIVCHGDAEMIRQLCVILLSNALKYSDEHGEIALTLRRQGRFCALSVRNSGEPIAPADRERIFDRFYRADTSRNREAGGSGLGLAIAKNIVEAHQGRIAVESSAGSGTTFTVTLHAGTPPKR